MYIVNFVILISVSSVGLANPHLQKFGLREQEAAFTSIDCEGAQECDDSRIPRKDLYSICGSNGETVEGRCQFIKKVCMDKDLEFLHYGPCTVSEKCYGHQVSTKRKESMGSQGLFIPSCNGVGYNLIQCHSGSGYCWCSKLDGTPIQDTAIRGAQPDCSAYSRMYQPTEQVIDPVSPRRAGGCKPKARMSFKKNMVENFMAEYKRSHRSESFGRSDSALQLASLTWKFHQLDTIGDGVLRRKEFRDIQRIVKKIIRPKKCAKNFPKLCDSSGDGVVTLKEWTSCFASSKIYSRKNKGGRSSQKPSSKRKKKKKRRLGKGKISKPRPCEHERRTANETKNGGNVNVYIPKCSKNGLYKTVQCYGAGEQWYCFCVNIHTGAMIENTHVKNGTPQLCPVSWPKCSPPDKALQFVRSLKSFFREFVQSSIARKYSLRADIDRENDLPEVIFNYFDKNNNGYIDKNEKKHLKDAVRKQRNLRRCGRKIHKVCDLNSDKRISQSEFSHCIFPSREKSQRNSVVDVNFQNSKGERGKNPFIEYFKAEDSP